ncbi:biotin--[acetyl-CoA-carboxylase] ligase [Geothrix sp. PMB-07]|uniref:biotin--[acetyl-CoA-carboxylase] ligase n=1 Tax=Geothrix sp. PMB-07 TaxID=3068640 RepID=UPI0027408406|nr:biotin--[acetyl-CoA-carboxylase] ligase [Geothrix sp. PMB-07]WLT33433.1 biotin--[acetyl-CoA-carboxylase] ligase [Geothrix sp. PMB-07]
MERRLIHLPVVDSTQAFLRRNPHLGFCTVLADRQTEGRGRQGNRWESAAGAGLWMSAALPASSGVAPGVLLQRAMAAAAQVLDPEGQTLGLKWPNDLVARREAKLVKLGGIIGEQVAGRLILGLGVNLSAAPHLPERTFAPACLEDVGLQAPSAPALALRIAGLWEHLDADFRPLFRWPEAGLAIHWEEGQGTALGWEFDGRLKVATSEGIRRLSVGEVRGLG